MKKIEIAPEWILEKLPHTQDADGSGNISVYTGNATDANWIELALDTLNISYETYDYLDDHKDLVFGFDFRIEEVQSDCPNLYRRMRKLDNINNYKKKLIKN
jgi:hypothetical protein